MSAAIGPVVTKREIFFNGILLLVAALPFYGVIPRAAAFAGGLSQNASYLGIANVLGCALIAFYSPLFFVAIFMMKSDGSIDSKDKGYTTLKEVPDFIICGQKFSIVDLYTNVLITGKIGSGKTSVAIWSVMGDLFKVFSRDKPLFAKDPFLKLGGLSLDVKGEFFEGVLWFAHQSGRNVLEEVKIIRPKVHIPVAKFVDERGYFFFLSALQVSTGTEFGHFVARFKMNDGQPFPMDIATKSQGEREALEAELREQKLAVEPGSLSFVGWRAEGSKLIRVSHTPEFGKVEYVYGPDKKPITIEEPKTLTFVELVGQDNGLRFNLVNPKLSAAEVAKRLVNIGKLVDGGKGGGENAYFDKTAARTVAMCIEGWRIVKPTIEISGPDILRITSQKEALKEIVEGLRDKTERLEKDAAEIKNPVKQKELLDLKRKCDDIRKYFVDSWEKLEPKTKSIVESVIQNMFGEFITDGNLQVSFCSPTTFTFDDCVQKGTFFCFVAGREYEALSKVMATALKMQFQSVMLERPSSAHLNQTRTIALIIDECQSNAVAGGSTGSGDEHFMSLARQSKVINLNATQSDSSLIAVIGKENANVYLQQYGGRVWFQNSDPDTNKRAAESCGQIHKERIDLRNPDFEAEVMFGLKDSDKKVKHDKEYKKTDRFASDEFASLDVFESVTLNMGRKGHKEKVWRQKNKPHAYSGPDNRPNIAKLLRWYIQAYVEQLAFHRKETSNYDHAATSYVPVANSVAPAAAPTAVPIASAPTVPPVKLVAPNPPPIVPPPIVKPVPPAPTGGPAPAPAPGGAQDSLGDLGAPTAEEVASADLDTPIKSEYKGNSMNVRPLLERMKITVRPVPSDTASTSITQAPEQEQFSRETNEALSAGKISMAELEEIREFYRDPKTNVARVSEMLENVTHERMINPQAMARELIIGRERSVEGAADRVAVSAGGQIAGNAALVSRSKPTVTTRASLGDGESLDLAGEVSRRQRSRLSEVHAKLEKVTQTSTSPETTVSPEMAHTTAMNVSKKAFKRVSI